MVKHIVLFRLKKEASVAEKEKVSLQFKQAIEALPESIDLIRNIEVGINTNPNESWDIALYSEFDSFEDLKAYAVHPDHVAAGKLLADLKEDRSCVDYVV